MGAMTEHSTAPQSAEGADLTWHTPSPRLLRLRQIEVAVITVPLAFLVALSFRIKHGVTAGAVSLVVVLALGALLALFVHRRFRAWRYQERYEDLVVARGVLIQRMSVVPYGRMQFVELTAGPFERMFALSTVKLHTAAAASRARIPGLRHEEAARLRDRLTELGEAKAAGL